MCVLYLNVSKSIKRLQSSNCYEPSEWSRTKQHLKYFSWDCEKKQKCQPCGGTKRKPDAPCGCIPRDAHTYQRHSQFRMSHLCAPDQSHVLGLSVMAWSLTTSLDNLNFAKLRTHNTWLHPCVKDGFKWSHETCFWPTQSHDPTTVPLALISNCSVPGVVKEEWRFSSHGWSNETQGVP